MAKNKKTTQTPNKKVPYNLPKGSLVRVNLGQSFAEYDLTRVRVKCCGNDFIAFLIFASFP